MRRPLSQITLICFAVVLAAFLSPASPASALVHIAEIHEVMSGFDGDADVQYVEINMRRTTQNITAGAKLSAFDASGTFIDGDAITGGDQPLITIPDDVPNAGDGVRWIMGTTAFETASGIQTDFEFSASPGLPAGAGMVCLFKSVEDFTNPASIPGGDIKPFFSAKDIRELTACLADGGGIHQGHDFLEIFHDQAIKKPFIAILQRGKEYVLFNIAFLAPHIRQYSFNLGIHGTHSRGQQASQFIPVPFFFGEGGRLVMG